MLVRGLLVIKEIHDQLLHTHARERENTNSALIVNMTRLFDFREF